MKFHFPFFSPIFRVCWCPIVDLLRRPLMLLPGRLYCRQQIILQLIWDRTACHLCRKGTLMVLVQSPGVLRGLLRYSWIFLRHQLQLGIYQTGSFVSMYWFFHGFRSDQTYEQGDYDCFIKCFWEVHNEYIGLFTCWHIDGYFINEFDKLSFTRSFAPEAVL